MNTFFDQIYLINLDRCPEKLHKVQRSLRKLGIEHMRISAVDGKTMVSQYEQLRNGGSKINSCGALGCLMSHVKVVEDAKKNGYDKICILEDDVMFHKDFTERFSNEISKIPDDWEMIHLGTSQKPTVWPTIRFEETGFSIDEVISRNINGYYKANKSRGTFAYCIRSSIYNDLLRLWLSKRKPVDVLLNKIFIRGRSYVIYPNLIVSDVTKSETQEQRRQMVVAIQVKWNMLNYC